MSVRAYVVQNDFTHGAWSQDLLARVDLKWYTKAAQIINNFQVKATGGVETRFGLGLTDVDLSIIPITATLQRQAFVIDNTQKFFAVFWENNLIIIKDTPDISEVAIVFQTTTPYNDALLAKKALKFDTNQNLMVVSSGEFVPHGLLKTGTADSAWEFKPLSFKIKPGHDFKNNYDDVTFTLSTVTVGDGRTLTANTPIFSNDYEGAYITGIGDLTAGITTGFAILTTYVSPTEMTVSILSPFTPSFLTGQKGKDDVILTESSWSTTHGFPRAIAFHQGRLIFASTKDLPVEMWGSVVGDFVNFNIGTAQDSDALDFTLVGQFPLEFILSSRDLLFFSTEIEYAVLQNIVRALTPTNFAAPQESTRGISPLVPPLRFNNQILIVAAGGKSIVGVRFSDTVNGYEPKPISQFSTQLIKNPQSWDIFQRPTLSENEYVYIINEDGTLTMLQHILLENVTAFSSGDLTSGAGGKGEFKDVLAVKESVYFFNQRTLNGQKKWTLERRDETLTLDAATTLTFGTPTSTITGLEFYTGEEVNLIGDGRILLSQVVPSNGSLTLERDVSELIVGFGFIATLQPMPVNLQTQDGTTLDRRKNLTKIYIDFQDSRGIKVDGTLIPDLMFSNEFFSEPPPQKSGIFEISPLSGFERRPAPIITVDIPTKATIRSVGYEVTV